MIPSVSLMKIAVTMVRPEWSSRRFRAVQSAGPAQGLQQTPKETGAPPACQATHLAITAPGMMNSTQTTLTMRITPNMGLSPQAYQANTAAVTAPASAASRR